MSIRITCLGCGQKYKAPDKAAGQMVQCPKCSKGISIPEPSFELEEPPPLAGLFDELGDVDVGEIDNGNLLGASAADPLRRRTRPPAPTFGEMGVAALKQLFSSWISGVLTIQAVSLVVLGVAWLFRPATNYFVGCGLLGLAAVCGLALLGCCWVLFADLMKTAPGTNLLGIVLAAFTGVGFMRSSANPGNLQYAAGVFAFMFLTAGYLLVGLSLLEEDENQSGLGPDGNKATPQWTDAAGIGASTNARTKANLDGRNNAEQSSNDERTQNEDDWEWYQRTGDPIHHPDWRTWSPEEKQRLRKEYIRGLRQQHEDWSGPDFDEMRSTMEQLDESMRSTNDDDQSP